MATRHIIIRAKNAAEARKFATGYRKLSTSVYYAERVTSVKLNKQSGLAAGVPGYKVGFTRRKR